MYYKEKFLSKLKRIWNPLIDIIYLLGIGIDKCFSIIDVRVVI